MPDQNVTSDKVCEAAAFLKALANEHRLLLLCHLAEGEQSVSQLEKLMQIRQPTLSQQLSRLRAENLVSTRRDAKNIYYSLASDEVRLVIQLLYELFCSDGAELPRSLVLEYEAE